MSGKFLAILVASILVYFVLDYVLSNAMLYMIGGIIGGSISEGFRLIGIKAGMVLVGLVWLAILTGVILMFYRTNSSFLKYIFILLIAALLYVIDMFVANIPYSDSADSENIKVISNIIIGVLILVKSVILSLIIYTGFSKN